MSTASVLREQIAGLVREYYQQQFANRTFNAGTDLVHYAGRVFDDEELRNVVDASLDFFLTANRYSDRFESDFADYLGLSRALLVHFPIEPMPNLCSFYNGAARHSTSRTSVLPRHRSRFQLNRSRASP